MFSGNEILGQKERVALVDAAKKLTREYAIEACCAYGSKVAGYARSDSDYDLLVVLKNYGHVIKYAYIHDSLDLSVLIVDSKALIRDAEKAALGEFVVGRLLHAYEPLENAKYFEKVETAYKKRVILEEIKELAATNALYDEILIPPEYFLYSKVQKRAKVYPHALYSYIKTYSGSNAPRNLEASKKGFVQALKQLEEEGCVEFVNEHARIMPEKVMARKGGKASLDMSNMMRGTLSYLVHTYAGRRTLNFVKQEAMSKIKRHKKIKNDIPPELKNPKSLLRLKEGIIVDGKTWLKELASKMGFKDYTAKERKIGDIHAATTLYTISENGRTEKIVAKHFASVKAVKWAAMNLWVAGIKKFQVDPSVRLNREYGAMLHMKTLGINTPEILAVAPDKRLLITRYIEGETLSDIISSVLDNKTSDMSALVQFGKLLHKLHASGCTLVDTKPSNMLVSNGRIYLTDLEQFAFSNDKAWDVICFIYYSMKFTSNIEGARKIVRALLDGYMQDGDVPVIKKSLSKKYLPAFYPALVVGVVTAVRDEIKSYINAS
jgi:tRNA A-37 threonylcarbamoyl transferase component Bud32/predicted nucleotidyltransferase